MDFSNRRTRIPGFSIKYVFFYGFFEPPEAYGHDFRVFLNNKCFCGFFEPPEAYGHELRAFFK